MKICRQEVDIILATKKLTYSELSSMCGFAPSTLHRGIHGGELKNKTVGVIAERLGVLVEQIVLKEE